MTDQLDDIQSDLQHDLTRDLMRAFESLGFSYEDSTLGVGRIMMMASIEFKKTAERMIEDRRDREEEQAWHDRMEAAGKGPFYQHSPLERN